ncbi:MAG: putative transcriptional regulatory protein [Bacillales bacterium]|jgi:YebC/PmpR family DNA-binding regulatory protein|nr:putative transcriptional regulatory protein [Bacillales bacterium]
MGRVQNPKKGAIDANRSKIFMKISKEIYVAAKNGGTDPAGNTGLRLAIEKAKAAHTPKDTIDRAIKKAAGAGAGENYEEIMYEGYGPGGIAVLVQCMTDNRNRTATNVRTAFGKNGGNLGESGSVAYMFNRKGYLAISREDLETDEDDMMMIALDAGAEDMRTTEYAFEIYTDTNEFLTVKENIEKEGYTFVSAEISMIPTLYNALPTGNVAQMEKLLSVLEDDDDVQNFWHNWEE